MSLDVNVSRINKVTCPHCGEFIEYKQIGEELMTGGRSWYTILEKFEYYAPYEERKSGKKKDWYGEFMYLTEEQAKEILNWIPSVKPYNWAEIRSLILETLYEGDIVAIRADW